MTRRSPRYAITGGPGGVELTCLVDSWLGVTGCRRLFISSGTYVYEVLDRQSMRTRQVCLKLAQTGPTLTSTPRRLKECIRRQAAACLVEEDRKP